MKKRILFDKWVMTTILYLGVVIGGFSAYENFIKDEVSPVSATSHEQHRSSSANAVTSEVNVYVQANQKEIKIFLKDKTGNSVNDLEINHEKILHLIIVDEQLQKYYHLHPEQLGNGEFKVEHTLPEGFYKAFIDIKPKNLAYQVTPVPFIAGSPSGLPNTHNEELKTDQDFTRHIDGETVKLNLSSAKANQPVTLTFDLDKTNLMPYLGAMGHVVILDERAQSFLHVHPTNDQEPVFETQFDKPGIYKIWAEFKQNGQIRAFPFVVEIKGEDE